MRASEPSDAAEGLPRLKAMLIEALAAAAAGLTQPDFNAAQIHDARIHLKRCAALVRAFEPAIGRDAKTVKRAVKNAHRMLAAARDDAVLPETLIRLDVTAPAKSAALAEIEARRLHDPAPASEAALHGRRLTGLAKTVEAWPAQTKESERALETIAEAYRTAKHLGRTAFDRNHGGDIHELRRLVIRLWHLSAAWRPQSAESARSFKRLREALGSHQDLDTLKAFLRGSSLDLKVVTEIVSAIRKRQKEARLRAEKHFRRLFAEPTEKFGATLLWPRQTEKR